MRKEIEKLFYVTSFFSFRYHAVLQFGRPTEDDDVEFQKDGSAGFYLYDLNSTHGTSLNKAAVPHHKYYRVKVGHMMKFGGSSRIYILQVCTTTDNCS